jgi:hypothetical protein
MVATLATGKVRTRTTPPAPGGPPYDLAWTDGGRYLGFVWAPATSNNVQVRLLDTAASGSNPLAAPVIATGEGSGMGFLADGLVVADGHGILASGFRLPATPGGKTTFKLAELSVPGGHVARAYPAGPGPVCQILSVTANGQHALLRCPGFERLDNGRITRLVTPPRAAW